MTAAAALWSAYDVDPDALAWARARVEARIARLETWEREAWRNQSRQRAMRLRWAAGFLREQLLDAGQHDQVLAVFDARHAPTPEPDEVVGVALSPQEVAAELEQRIRDVRARLDAEYRERQTAGGVPCPAGVAGAICRTAPAKHAARLPGGVACGQHWEQAVTEAATAATTRRTA